ncbi:MAG: polynucleotide adenylyltransferase PcnB, partial [Gammaproteobacteria bacterium]|nr:polynucleotide adenylyltransferase PcnB [Gammaproteobacteria bacterium]
RIALPRRFSFPMREMLQLQPRFLQQRGRRALNLMSHKRFRAAYDLMLLRASAGEVAPDIADFWTEIQEQTPQEQRQTLGIDGRRRNSGRRKRRQSASP